VCPADRLCPAKCGVSECDYEVSKMRMPWLIRGCCARGEKKILIISFSLVLITMHIHIIISSMSLA
jgi:hypothetical protein